MKTLFIECKMGAAGDMLSAALLELCEDKEAFLDKMNSLGLPATHIYSKSEEKCGIVGTRLVVEVHGEEEGSGDHNNLHHHENGDHDHDHEHDHDHDHDHEHEQSDHEHGHGHHHDHERQAALHDIESVIGGLSVSEGVKENAIAVYHLIAQAESNAHGKPVDLVHFHEVGALDAVADIVGFCILVETLGVHRIIASPVAVGYGQVRTSHGILPVPAPATAHILLGVPTYAGKIEGELCTPTGAALLRHFSKEFMNMPPMVIRKIGYGMGKKNFVAANCVRAFLGDQEEETTLQDKVVELRCNIDDMTPEAVGYTTHLLMLNGAKDVYVETVLMKKNRPGFIIVCLCAEEQADKFAVLLLKHTTTIGVRKYHCERYILERNTVEIETTLGIIRTKISTGYGITKSKPEFDDVAKIASEYDISYERAEKTITAEYEMSPDK